MQTDPPPLRFVVLRHEGIDDPHFDLLIERSPGAMLEAFRSPAWPIIAPTELSPLPDHRREYLQYEGPVSNNRGHVNRVIEGIALRSEGGTIVYWTQQAQTRSLTIRRDESRRLAGDGETKLSGHVTATARPCPAAPA